LLFNIVFLTNFSPFWRVFLQISAKTAGIPNVAGVSLVPDVLTVVGLPPIAVIHLVIGVPAVAFLTAVAGDAVAGVAVAGVSAGAGILFVAESLVSTGCTLPESIALEPISVNPLRRPCPL
jgi:hypothetical protein